MNQQELLYGYSSVAIAATLFIAIVAIPGTVYLIKENDRESPN